MSLMRSWWMEGKAPLGQLKGVVNGEWCPHGQRDGTLLGVRPDVKQRVSLNACLWRLKMDGVSRGMEVSHDKAPFLAGLLMAHCWALNSLGFSAITSLVASLWC